MDFLKGKDKQKQSPAEIIEGGWQHYRNHDYFNAVKIFKEYIKSSNADDQYYIDAIFALIVMFEEGVFVSKALRVAKVLEANIDISSEGSASISMSAEKSTGKKSEANEKPYISIKSEHTLKEQIDGYKKILNEKQNEAKFFYLKWLKKLSKKEDLFEDEDLLFSLTAEKTYDKATSIQLKAVASVILVKGNFDKEFTKKNDDETTLYLAIKKKQFELAELLLEYKFPFFPSKIKPFSPDSSGTDLLKILIFHKKIKMIESFLLKSGFNLDALNNDINMHSQKSNATNSLLTDITSLSESKSKLELKQSKLAKLKLEIEQSHQPKDKHGIILVNSGGLVPNMKMENVKIIDNQHIVHNSISGNQDGPMGMTMDEIKNGLIELAEATENEILLFVAGLIKISSFILKNRENLDKIIGFMKKAYANGNGIGAAGCYLWLLNIIQSQSSEVNRSELTMICSKSDHPLASLLLTAINKIDQEDKSDEVSHQLQNSQAKQYFNGNYLGKAPEITRKLLEFILYKKEVAKEFKEIVSLSLIELIKIDNPLVQKNIIESKQLSSVDIDFLEYLIQAADTGNPWALIKKKELETLTEKNKRECECLQQQIIEVEQQIKEIEQRQEQNQGFNSSVSLSIVLERSGSPVHRSSILEEKGQKSQSALKIPQSSLISEEKEQTAIQLEPESLKKII